MQVIEGTVTMTEALQAIKEKVGACSVEPIIEKQGDETHVSFRVQHEVKDEA